MVTHKPTAETLALIDRIERGEAEMAGPFKTFEEYKAWLAEDNDAETGTHSDILE